jgi:hypothetical protein
MPHRVRMDVRLSFECRSNCSKGGGADTKGTTVAFWNHHESIVRLLFDGATVEFSPVAKLEIGRAYFSTLLRVGVSR